MAIWIVTGEVNAYEQAGEYFVGAFNKQPGFAELRKLIDNSGDRVSDATIGKLTRGGGREGIEDIWYNLHEVKNGEWRWE